MCRLECSVGDCDEKRKRKDETCQDWGPSGFKRKMRREGARGQQSSRPDDEECQTPNLGQDGSTTPATSKKDGLRTPCTCRPPAAETSLGGGGVQRYPPLRLQLFRSTVVTRPSAESCGVSFFDFLREVGHSSNAFALAQVLFCHPKINVCVTCFFFFYFFTIFFFTDLSFCFFFFKRGFSVLYDWRVIFFLAKTFSLF